VSARGSWNWMDPLGVRGSRLDPAVLMRDIGRAVRRGVPLVDFFGPVLRSMHGRSFEVAVRPPVRFVLERVVDTVPANEVVVGTRGAAVPIWRSVELDVTDIEVGPFGADRARVTATDVRYVDEGKPHLRVGSCSARVRLSAPQFALLVAELAPSADIDAVGTRLVVRPQWGRGRVAVDVTASMRHGTLHLRPDAVQAGSVSRRASERLPLTCDFPLPGVPDDLTVTDVEAFDDTVEATVSFGAVEIPVDLAAVLTQAGGDGARVLIRTVSGGRWRP